MIFLGKGMLAYAKPQIIMLDDDSSLLDVIEFYFNEKFQNAVLVKTFLKSENFFLYIEENCYLFESPSSILNTFYTNKLNNKEISKTLHDLTKISAIIILDQELRGEKTTGIEISTSIRNYFPNSYICMLTSNIPNEKAVNLHNSHNIDLFIDKKDPNSIDNLYRYLSIHLEELKKDYLFDSIDLFGKSGNLDNENYLINKEALLKNNNPQCFLTLNENGDIAMIQENQHISHWKFSSSNQRFIKYE